MQEIDLQTFIYQIKRDLLAPNPAQRARDPYPLFFIDRLDLEIAIKAQINNKGEISFSVLNFGASAGISKSHEQYHVVKLSLSPLLSKEKITADLLKDPVVAERITKYLSQAMLKTDSGLVGEPE
jgi:hypothetical protein